MACPQKRNRSSRNPQKTRKIIFGLNVKKTSLHCSSLMVSLSFAITGLQREVSSNYLKLPGNSIEMVGFKREGLAAFRGIPRHPAGIEGFAGQGPESTQKALEMLWQGKERERGKVRNSENFKANFFEHPRPNSEAFRGTPQTATQGQIGLEFSKYMKSGCSG